MILCDILFFIFCITLVPTRDAPSTRLPSNRGPSITRFCFWQTKLLCRVTRFDSVYTWIGCFQFLKVPSLKSQIAYVSKSLLPRDQSPFERRVGHKTRCKLLAHLARVFLCAPASTVYSERLFSEAGNVYEEKRNRLPTKPNYLPNTRSLEPSYSAKYRVLKKKANYTEYRAQTEYSAHLQFLL